MSAVLERSVLPVYQLSWEAPTSRKQPEKLWAVTADGDMQMP